MEDFKIYMLFPLVTGGILLLIEYGIIHPLQKLRNRIRGSKFNIERNDDGESKLGVQSIFWDNLLRPQSVFGRTLLIYLQVVFYPVGVILVSAASFPIAYLFVPVFDQTVKVDSSIYTVYSPLITSLEMTLGASMLWVSLRLSKLDDLLYSSFSGMLRLLLWAAVIFNILVATAMSLLDGGWIAAINGLSGTFFCVYLDTAIQASREKPTSSNK